MGGWMKSAVCVAVAMIFCAVPVGAVTVYVSPQGSDEAMGTSKQPLATLAGARDRVRQLRQSGALREAVTVEFADGEYVFAKPVVFEPEDSGTPESPMTYTAAKGAKPVFFGGKRLPPFEVGADGVWRTRVGPAFRFEQLYLNGRRAVRARSPNSFYYYMQAPAPYGYDPLTGKAADLSHRAFIAAPEDLAPLAGKSREELSDVMVTVYHAWEASQAHVQAVEPATGRMVVTGSSPWSFFNWGTYLPRYHIENFKEALDAPGEWFLDRAGTLSYLPLPGEKPGKTEAVAPVTEAFLKVKGDAMKGQWISDLTFSGLTFLYAAYRLPEIGRGDGQAAVSQPAAVELDGARRVAFRDCVFAHVGTHGLWFRKGCREDTVERSHLFDLGGGAVRIGDSKWSRSELPDKLTGQIVVDNNILHGGGRLFHGATGVWIGHASDVQVTHNDIGDFLYTGISMGWTWGYQETATHRNTLAFNHIHHLGWGVLSDMGGIYTLGRSDGSCISNNVIHDVYSYDYTGRGGWGLYTDEGSARMVFENNLIHHTKTGNIHQHYGRENVFRNNILAYSMDGQIQRSRIEEHTAFFFTNNIVYWDNASAAFWRGHAGAAGTVTDVVVNANIYWNPAGIASNAFNCGSWESWRAAGQDAQSKIVDPLFRNAAKGDFRFRLFSPAVKAGFRPIDSAQAGVYGTRAWRKLASRETYAPVVFAPVPERYVVRKLSENFDGVPLKAPFPNVATHVENKGDSVSVTDEVAFSGKQSLKVQDAAGLRYSYDPHFTFACAFTNAVVENRFAVRVQAGAEFFTEWRDYPEGGGNGYVTGPSLIFRQGKVFARARFKSEGGSLQNGERLIAELPADTWAQVTVTAGVGSYASGLWSVKLARAGQPDIVVADLYLSSPEWKAMEWLGFCSTAKSAVAYYLDDFMFGEKK
jgi:hypothetical protein